MKHRDIVIEKNKFIAEIGKGFFTKARHFFDWQYSGFLDGESPTVDDEVKIEFYWNVMDFDLLLDIVRVMRLYHRMIKKEKGRYVVLDMKLIGGSHDMNDVPKSGFGNYRSHQVCLEITLSNKEKYK